MFTGVCVGDPLDARDVAAEPQTVGSTIVWTPLAYSASSLATASATRASSSHQSLP